MIWARTVWDTPLIQLGRRQAEGVLWLVVARNGLEVARTPVAWSATRSTWSDTASALRVAISVRSASRVGWFAVSAARVTGEVVEFEVIRGRELK